MSTIDAGSGDNRDDPSGSGATIGRGGQLTRPQDISSRRGSRYNNGLQSYFFGPIEERRNEHLRRIDDFGLLRNSSKELF
jgi:hypothetical protein